MFGGGDDEGGLFGASAASATVDPMSALFASDAVDPGKKSGAEAAAGDAKKKGPMGGVRVLPFGDSSADALPAGAAGGVASSAAKAKPAKNDAFSSLFGPDDDVSVPIYKHAYNHRSTLTQAHKHMRTQAHAHTHTSMFTQAHTHTSTRAPTPSYNSHTPTPASICSVFTSQSGGLFGAPSATSSTKPAAEPAAAAAKKPAAAASSALFGDTDSLFSAPTSSKPKSAGGASSLFGDDGDDGGLFSAPSKPPAAAPAAAAPLPGKQISCYIGTQQQQHSHLTHKAFTP